MTASSAIAKFQLHHLAKPTFDTEIRMHATAPDFTANAAQSAETMLRNANQQIFGLQAENRELRIALTEAAQTMRNLSHLSAKYRTMLASKESRT